MTGPDIESRQATFLRSGILNTGAVVTSLPRTASVGDTILYSPRANVLWVMVATAVDSSGSGVTWSRAGDTDYSLLPPVRLVSWSGREDTTQFPMAAGSPANLGQSRQVLNVHELLPPRTGFTRQYRLSAVFYLTGNSGVTAWRALVWLHLATVQGGTVTVLSTPEVNLLTPSLTIGLYWADSSWVTNSTLDALTAWCRCGLTVQSDWAGSVGSVLATAVTLDGRYV